MNYAQPAPPKRGVPIWLVVLLVSLGLLVFVIAVMGILAVVGVRKYVGASKQIEAVMNVNEIARDAVVAQSASGDLCKSASSPVPASISMVSAKKWMSSPGDWTKDAADTGFACLKFEQFSPQYYQYDYKLDSPFSFTAIAHGDLNGDGVTSEFTMKGNIVGPSVILDPTVTKVRPDE